MNVLVTGISGYIGSRLAARLVRDGHVIRGLSRRPDQSLRGASVVTGDAISGKGLTAALDGIDVAYFLIHSMETVPDGAGTFAERDREAAARFAEAARRAGVRRVVYLGGLVPREGRASAHLASRLEVEDLLLDAAPEAVAMRASIVIGARSRSFRFLVRLVERVPVMALPAWRANRTQPIDARDVLAFLVAAGTSGVVDGPLSVDIAGPDVLTYAELVERIRDALLIGRPRLDVPVTMTPVASRVAAAIAGEDPELIGPLMEGLSGDLLPRDDRAAGLFGVRLHHFSAAVDRALRDLEATEELAAR
jgi:uncharacterized protein YbjT (DUF2867 family)